MEFDAIFRRKIKFDDIKNIIYKQIRNTLYFYVYEENNEAIHNEIKNRIDAIISPLKDCSSIYDYCIDVGFDYQKNGISVSFSYKIFNDVDFTTAKFLVYPDNEVLES